MKRCLIIGAGFSGLTLAYELVRNHFEVTVVEKEAIPGGLASGFEVLPGKLLERFYHHWFSNDVDIFSLLKELGLEHNIIKRESNTGFYYKKSLFKLSSPLDLIRFKVLSFPGRIRLALFTLYSRTIKDFSYLENISALDWVKSACGSEVTEKVWFPLLKGKFGEFYDKVAAVWLWNKVKLRGSSRNNRQHEILYYYHGGFQALINDWFEKLKKSGVKFFFNSTAESFTVNSYRKLKAVKLSDGRELEFDYVFLTIPLPEIKKILPEEFHEKESWDIPFLGNRCLILLLKQSLSNIYWLNVADPSFPFVGVIEHTNFDDPLNYNGAKVAYLSRYMPEDDPLFSLPSQDYYFYCLEHLKKMFPKLDETWIINYWDWKATYAQPIVIKNYRSKIPPFWLQGSNVYISTMAQIFPEDRGTNYAVKYSRAAFNEFIKSLTI